VFDLDPVATRRKSGTGKRLTGQHDSVRKANLIYKSVLNISAWPW